MIINVNTFECKEPWYQVLTFIFWYNSIHNCCSTNFIHAQNIDAIFESKISNQNMTVLKTKNKIHWKINFCACKMHSRYAHCFFYRSILAAVSHKIHSDDNSTTRIMREHILYDLRTCTLYRLTKSLIIIIRTNRFSIHNFKSVSIMNIEHWILIKKMRIVRIFHFT